MRKGRWLKKAVAYVLSFCMLISGLVTAEPVKAYAEGTTTVYFLNTGGWSNIKVHGWIDGVNSNVFGEWPGASAEAASEVGSNWWKINVPYDASVQGFNIMFTDNGSETSRVTAYINDRNNVYLTTENDKSYASSSAAEAAMGVGGSGDTTTLYFLNSKGWSSIYGYIYINDAPAGTAYPGTAAAAAPEKGENWWKLTVQMNASNEPFNVIFNDGGDNNQADAFITDTSNVYITADGEKFSSAQAAQTAAGVGGGSGSETGGETTLYFLNSKGWSKIYAYAYANGADVGSAWPGTEAVTAPEKGTNWWKATVSTDQAFSIIFHDGSAANKVELAVSSKNNTHITASGGAYETVNEAEISEGMGDISKATTVYFKNSKGWLNVYGYVYANEMPIGSSWPGTKATEAPEKGTNWWKIIVPKEASAFPFNVIFNDGNANRAEVEISDNSSVYVTPAGDKYDNTEAADEATAGDVGGDIGGGDVGVNPDLKYDVDLSGAGAALPYTTYEAESAATNAQIFPKSTKYLTDIQSEASGRQAVKLANTGDYVEFTLTKPANAFVVRYNMPDSADGAGVDANLSLYVNGKDSQDLALTSKYAWIYGSYPYTNSPGQGKGHRFFDETRAFFPDGTLPAGTKIRLQKDAGDTASYYTIDFIECEMVDAALTKTADSLSITDYGAVADDGKDDSEAILKCIEAAKSQGKEVWIPAGTFDLPEKKSFDVSDVTIRGAGMWYSNLYGAGASFHYQGTCKFYDFAMTGVSTVRDDAGDLAAFEGTGYATNVTIQNIWIEHVKVGLWSYNTTNLVVQGCRIRNTYADGINLCSATNNATVRNNSLRNTGDDCIAIWPWQGDSCNNTIAYNTVQCPTLANGIALYGGSGNKVEYNHVSDSINNGSGICVGTDYDTPNGFTGTTTVSNNVLVRCGSYHCDYDYQVGAIWIWATKKPMTAVFDIRNNTLYDCSYEGVLIDNWNTISGLNIKDNSIYGATTDGVFIRGNSSGTATIENLGVAEYGGALLKNEAENFSVTQSGSGIHETTMPDPGEKKTFIVTFDYADGTEVVTQTVAEGETVSEPKAPVRDGYEFLGWYHGNAKYDFAAGVDANIRLTAQWQRLNANYVIRYYRENTAKSEYVLSEADTTEGQDEVGKTITVTPQALVGFTLNSAKSKTSGEVLADGSLALELYYDRNVYTITYETDGGTQPAKDKTEYVYGVGLQPLGTTAKDGYAFEGWYDEDDNIVTRVTNTQTGNIVLHAKWQQLSEGEAAYTVFYYEQNRAQDDYNRADRQTIVGKVGDTVTAEAPDRPGFTYDEEKSRETASGTIAEDGSLELYLYYTRNVYPIHYVLDGGVNNADNPDTYLYEVMTMLQDATKEGYIFNGWFEDEAHTKRIRSVNTGTIGEVTVYASWTKAGDPSAKTHRITYIVNGGTRPDTLPSYYEEGVGAVLGDPVYDDHEFLGWYTTSDFEEGTRITEIPKDATTDYTLYAKWNLDEETQKRIHNITYVLYGDETVPGTFEEEKEMRLMIPSRDGWRFDGWYTTPEFTLGTGLTRVPLTQVTDLVVYAKWTKLEVNYTVTFNSNGGTAVAAQTVEAGAKASQPAAPTRNGFVFKGWYLEGRAYDFAAAVNGNITLVAQWEAVKASPVKVTGITISGISKKIAAGKKIQLTAAVAPVNATDSSVTWTIKADKNAKYAAVDAKTGLVTTKKAGKNKTVTVIATANDGSGKTAEYKIKLMQKAVKKIVLKASATKVKAGKKVKIKATVTPKASTKKINKTLKWESSNTKYATVTKKGVVKTKKAGKGKTVRITARATDGSNKKKTIKIKITK